MCETSLVTHHALRIRAVNRLNSQRTKFNAETRLILLAAREKLAEIARKSRRCSCHNTSFNCKMTQILASAEKPQRHEGFSRTTMRFSNYTIQTPRVLEYLSSKPLGSCQRNLNSTDPKGFRIFEQQTLGVLPEKSEQLRNLYVFAVAFFRTCNNLYLRKGVL